MNLLRAPILTNLFLVAVLLVCGTVSMPQNLTFGSMTGLGVFTLLTAALAWTLWLRRPEWPRAFHAPLLSLALLLVYAAGSVLWYQVSFKGLQSLVMLACFLGLVLLTARQCHRHSDLPSRLHYTLDLGTAFAAVVYAASVPLYGMGCEDFLLARPLALFLLVGVARQTALWQAGRKSALAAVVGLILVIFISVSRVALGAAVLLPPLALLLRGDGRSIARAAGMAALAGGAFALAVYSNDTMYERFFGYDATMNFGGVYINGSGRAEMWRVLWESASRSPILGWGLGSSSALIDVRFPFPGVGHPHNDYLRFFHDFGLIGLSCWLYFAATAFLFLGRLARRVMGMHMADLPLYLTPVLALAALSVSMVTDNSVTYSFVMMPVAVLIGAAIGEATRKAEYRTDAIDEANPIERVARPSPRRASAPSLRGRTGYNIKQPPDATLN